MGTESLERPQQVVCYRAGNKPGGLDMEEQRKNEDWKLAYLLLWQAWLLGFQEMPAGVGDRDKE